MDPELTTEAPALRLAAFLREERERVVRAWMREVGGRPGLGHLSPPQLQDHVPQLLQALAEALAGDGGAGSGGAGSGRAGSGGELAGMPEVHALERLDAGVGLEAVVDEFGALRRCVLRLYRARLVREAGGREADGGAGAVRVDLAELERFDALVDAAVTAAVAGYSRARARTLEALERVSALAGGGGAAGAEGPAELEALLPRLLRVLLETTAAVDTATVLLREGDWLVARASEGLEGEVAAGLRLRVGEGFAGQVAAQGRPLFLRSAATDPLVGSEHVRARGVRALYGVPLSHGGDVIGVALVGSCTAWELSEEDRLLVRTMARRAAALLAQARLAQAEREARGETDAQRALLGQVLAQSGDGVVVTDAGGRVRFANREAERQYGAPLTGGGGARGEGAREGGGEGGGEGGAEGAVWLTAFEADGTLRDGEGRHLTSGTSPLLRALQGEVLRGVRVWLHRADGGHVPLSVTAGPLTGAEGRVEGAIVTTRDETHRLSLEQERGEARALLDSLMGSAAPVGVGLLDRHLRYVHLNRALAALHGRGPEACQGLALEALAPALYPTLAPLLHRVLERGESLEGVELSSPAAPGEGGAPGGRRHFLASYHPVPDARGRPSGVGVVVKDITERRRTEEALRESEERFRLLVQSARDVSIYLLDPAGRVTTWNTGAERTFGYAEGEVLGESHLRFYTPEDAAAGVPERLLAQAAHEGEAQVQGERVRKDGTRFWSEGVLTPLREPGGALRGFVKVTRDVTERRRAEESLRRTSERLRAILDTAVDGIITIDKRGAILSINPATTRIFGYSPEELLGRNVNVLMPREYAEHHDGYMEAYHRTRQRRIIGHGREVAGKRKDGSVFPLELAVSETALPGGEAFYTGVVRDISVRKEAEAARDFLAAAGHLLAQPLDAPSTLHTLAELAVSRLCDFCIVDVLAPDGALRRVEVLAGSEALQEALRRTLPFPPGPGSPLRRPLQTGEPESVEVTGAWLDAVAHGPEHRAALEALGPRSVALVPLVARGRTLGLLLLASRTPERMARPGVLDVAVGMADTAAIALDNARLLEQAQEAARTREEVVAVVSHDLRNPLQAVTLAATMLLKRPDADERTLRSASRILSAADRALGMIRDLLDFHQARGGLLALERRAVDLGALAERVADEVRMAHPERPLTVRAQGDCVGHFDEGRLSQVVANLVGNAVQHGAPRTPVDVSVTGDGAQVRLEVHNEGPAIPAELLPHLFEPYRRGRAGERRGADGGSLGLGLYITREIVRTHGGTLSVASSPSEGTTFTALLPRAPP
jgi:PAS domain S-box-containing protein